MVFIRKNIKSSMQDITTTKHKLDIGLGIDQVWIIAVLAAFGMIVALMPLIPNDFWWHLKLGEIISQTHTVPGTNMFAWTLDPNHPFVYGAWLAEYLLYLIYQLGKIPLVIFARFLFVLLAFALVGYEAKRRSNSWRVAGFVLMLACAMSSNNLEVRPQIFSWTPFVLTYILLSAYVDKQIKARYLLFCPLIMVFWVNVHGSFILGLILFGIYFTGEAIRLLLKLSGALTFLELRWLAIVGILQGLAVLVNPHFINIIHYVYNLMTDKPSQKLVIEWQPPAPNTYATIAFFASILILMAFLAYSRYRPTPTEIILIFSFLWLAWSGLRYVIWFGMVSMPILARVIRELLKGKTWLEPAPKNVLNLIFVAILCIPVVAFQPWFIDRLPLPPGYSKLVLRDNPVGPQLSVNTPVAAVEYLKAHPGGNLYNEMGYGSYLIWADPAQGVFVDPRVELYPYQQWLDYIKINNGLHYNDLFNKYGVDRILLNKEIQPELMSELEKDPTWRQEYTDLYAQIWVKNP
jgi:hypothetical protein